MQMAHYKAWAPWDSITVGASWYIVMLATTITFGPGNTLLHMRLRAILNEKYQKSSDLAQCNKIHYIIRCPYCLETYAELQALIRKLRNDKCPALNATSPEWDDVRNDICATNSNAQ